MKDKILKSLKEEYKIARRKESFAEQELKQVMTNAGVSTHTISIMQKWLSRDIGYTNGLLEAISIVERIQE